MTELQPGWIPNPNDPHEVQYWDGTAWTGSYQRWNGTAWVAQPTPTQAVSAARPPIDPMVRRKRKRLGLIIGLTAGGLVALLVGTLVFVNVSISNADPTAISSRSIVRTDERAGYDYTEPALAIEDRSIDFLFKTNFDPYDIPAWVEEEGEDPNGDRWAFRVYANEELTVEVPTTVFASYNSGRGFGIASYETRYASPYDRDTEEATVIRSTPVLDTDGKPVDENVDVNSLVQGAYTQGDWGLYEEYFLVRYIDADGAKLERPVVSEFSFAGGLATPSATIVADDTKEGATRFVWDPVPGAESYIVVKSYVDGDALVQWDGDLVSRDYVAVATTAETSWSTASQTLNRFGDPVKAADDPYLTTQNEALEMFATSQDEFVGDSLDRPLDHAQVEFGVIAVAADGTTSAFGRASVASGVASLPYELAVETLQSLDQCDGGYFRSECNTADQVATYVPYIALDGSTRVTPAHMNEEPWQVNGSRYVAAVLGEGTDLGYWAAIQANSAEEFRAAAVAFNERSLLAAPTTGLVETQLAGLTTVAETESEYSDEAGERANGSNELVEYIAAHLIDGHEAIDTSSWSDWSSTNIRDALEEAYWQNPIAGVEGYEYDSTEDLIIVAYEENRDERVADTAEAIERIIDEIITDGMSETEKVTAINDYIVDNVVYDYAAIEFAVISMPPGYEYAWTLSGALLDGSVVCVGYAQAFKALADAAGLESVIVTGGVVNSAVGHAWNKVKVDGQWYVVDTTWNDTPDRTKYLLISDSFFTGDSARYYDTDWVYDLYADTYVTG